VKIGGMTRGIVLVIGLGGIENIQRNYFGDNSLAENLRLVQLIDVGLCDVLLLGTRVEDCGSILRALVRTLTVQLGRVRRDGKKDLQQLSVTDLRRVVDHLNGFGVACLSSADDIVLCSCSGSTGVPGRGLLHAFNMLEYSLDSPKTSAGEDSEAIGVRGDVFVDGGGGGGGRGEEKGKARQDFTHVRAPAPGGGAGKCPIRNVFPSS